jgi:hypothetical protein
MSRYWCRLVVFGGRLTPVEHFFYWGFCAGEVVQPRGRSIGAQNMVSRMVLHVIQRSIRASAWLYDLTSWNINEKQSSAHAPLTG